MRICSSLRSCLGSAELVRRRRRRTILMRTLAVLVLCATTVRAQERPVGPLTLDQAVGFAIAHHPALQAEASAEEVRREQVSVARADYLPSVDLSLQINAGTGNVLRGGLYSMKGIPVVSGPPTGRSFNDASLGSLVGVGVSWDAIGLVQKMAEVDAALADEAQARATVEARRLAIAFAAADQFLDVLARAEAFGAGDRGARACLRYHRRGTREAGTVPRRRRVTRASGAGARRDSAHPRRAGRGGQPYGAGACARNRRRAHRDRRRQSARAGRSTGRDKCEASTRHRGRSSRARRAGEKARQRADVSAAARPFRVVVGARQRIDVRDRLDIARTLFVAFISTMRAARPPECQPERPAFMLAFRGLQPCWLRDRTAPESDRLAISGSEPACSTMRYLARPSVAPRNVMVPSIGPGIK